MCYFAQFREVAQGHAAGWKE